jgi:hypothetical protein
LPSEPKLKLARIQSTPQIKERVAKIHNNRGKEVPGKLTLEHLKVRRERC